MPNNYTYRFSDRKSDGRHDHHHHDDHDRHDHHHRRFYPPYRPFPPWFWLLGDK